MRNRECSSKIAEERLKSSAFVSRRAAKSVHLQAVAVDGSPQALRRSIMFQ